MLILGGLGQKIEDVPLGVLEYLKEADYIFIEGYTNVIDNDLISFIKNIREDAKIVDREFVETKLDKFIIENKDKKILLLVLGSPLFATTHISLIETCLENSIEYIVIGAASVLDYIPVTGLFIYKFGKTVSIPFHHTETPYKVIEENKRIGAHTLVLLDIDPKNNRYLSVNEALKRLLNLESKFKSNIINLDDKIVVCSNLGKISQKIYYDKIRNLLEKTFEYPACIIIPGNINRIEEEFLSKITK